MDKLTDARLRRALLLAAEEDFRDIWEEPEPELPEFSPAYLSWEEEFLSSLPTRRSARKPRQRNRVLLIAAAVIAVLLVGCASVIAADPEVRETVLQFFRREVVSNPRPEMSAETHTDDAGNFMAETQEWTVKFDDGTTERYFAISWEEGGLDQPLFSDEWEAFPDRWNHSSDTEEYPELGEWRLGWLPEGFAFEECEHTYNFDKNIMASAHFKDWDKVRITAHRLSYVRNHNNGQSKIILTYRPADGNMVLGLGGGSTVEALRLNGTPAYYIDHGQSGTLVWCDSVNHICYQLTGCAEYEELLAMAESVFPEK